MNLIKNNLIRKIQFIATSLYFILFFYFFNEINHGSFLERVFFATSASFFCTISVSLIVGIVVVLSFYKYYDYEDFIKR